MLRCDNDSNATMGIQKQREHDSILSMLNISNLIEFVNEILQQVSCAFMSDILLFFMQIIEIFETKMHA